MQQDYRPQNVWTEGGRLVIEARREADGALTSARIRTLGRFAIAPSAAYKTIKVEASMQLPQGGLAGVQCAAALSDCYACRRGHTGPARRSL